jgi:uncharacterized protein YcaQ
MCTAGEIAQISIKGLKRAYYCLAEDATRLRRCKAHLGDTVRFLSPFDNAIILRDRTRALFDFTYALECYTPRNKREYGYFCLPILWRSELVGRVDPKTDRQKNTLTISHLYIEKKVTDRKRFMRALSAALLRFASFNSCTRVTVSKHVPSPVRQQLSV